jgi:hypothetical protein
MRRMVVSHTVGKSVGLCRMYQAIPCLGDGLVLASYYQSLRGSTEKILHRSHKDNNLIIYITSIHIIYIYFYQTDMHISIIIISLYIERCKESNIYSSIYLLYIYIYSILPSTVVMVACTPDFTIYSEYLLSPLQCIHRCTRRTPYSVQ